MEQVQIEDKFLQGRKKAMALLGYKDRTEWELRSKLEEAELEEAVIEDAVAYVESFHYIDDERYAANFVLAHKDSKSIQRIQQELKKRHVPEELISQAVDNVCGDDSEALKNMIQKLLRTADGGLEQMSYREKQKLAAKLYRKGFRGEDISRELQM